jgi:HAD superfamily hydrolase (TIGR01490 family)
MTSVALFDLDRTLLDCNSGRLWVAAEWREGRLGARDVAWASWWLLRYSVGIGEGLEAVFATAVATLADSREDELAARTDRWFDGEVAQRLRPGARKVLDAHRAAGDRVVLATSGSHYSALAAQRLWGFDDLVATRFEVVDGRFTGRIASLAYGAAKAARVVEWAHAEGVDLTECTFYTDSITDLDLMERVGRPVAVNPDRRLERVARARGWTVADWGTS